MNLHRLFMIALLVILSGATAHGTQASNPSAPDAPGAEGGSAIGQTVGLTGSRPIHVEMSTMPPEPTEQQKAQRAQWEQTHPLKAEKPLPIGETAVQRSDSAADANTGTRAPLPGEAGAAPSSPAAPGTFTLFRNANMGATLKSNTSGLTGEPNAANSGATVFATGNWWDAISADGGQTFKYVNPFTMFPASFGGFCCDQHTLYDPSRDIFIWYLQYSSSGPAGAGQNIFRLAVARPVDALQGDWLTYDFTSASNTEWDYPDMCLSDNWVYLTTNRGVYNSSSVNDAFIFRIPLDTILSGSISYTSWDLASFGLGNISLKCTHGAREVMHFGSHNSTSQIRLFSQPDENTSLYWNGGTNLSVAWNNGTHICPTPDSRPWCGFDDGRVETAWIQSTRQGQLVGFMWNAAGFGGASNCNGTALSCPYLEAARVMVNDSANPATYTYYDRPFLWIGGGTAAAQYPAVGVNARGDLGLTFYYSDSSFDPYFGLGIDDDYHRCCGWDVNFVRSSTQGPNTNRWGDYYEVQPFAPNDLAWITIGQTMQGCGVAGCKESNYVIFGRERDLRSVQRYYNPFFSIALPLVDRQ